MFTSALLGDWPRPARRRAHGNSLYNLHAKELLPHEDVVAMAEERLLRDPEERAVLRSQVGQHEPGVGERDLGVAAADERIVREVDVVPLASEGDEVVLAAVDEADPAAAQQLH